MKHVELSELGAPIEPENVVQLESRNGRLEMAAIQTNQDDEFVKKVHASPAEFIILVDEQDEPQHVLNTDRFRSELSKGKSFDPTALCYNPLTFKSGKTSFLEALTSLRNTPAKVILVWDQDAKRIITNRDALRFLLKGIAD